MATMTTNQMATMTTNQMLTIPTTAKVTTSAAKRLSIREMTTIPPMTMKTLCHVNLRRYPRDVHHCNITLGSWTFSANDLNITAEKYKEDPDDRVGDSEWELKDTKITRIDKKYDCCPDLYTTVTAEITIARRKSSTFCYAILLPQTIAFLSTLVTFWLSPKHFKTRLMILGFSMFLCYATIHQVTSEIGIVTSGTPFPLRCAGVLIIMSAVAGLVTIVVAHISCKSKVSYLFMDNFLHRGGGNHAMEFKDIENLSSAECEKQMRLATVVDKSFFAIYLLTGVALHFF